MVRGLVEKIKQSHIEIVFCHRLPDRTPCIVLFGKPRRLLCYRCSGALIGIIIPWILLIFSSMFRRLVFLHSVLGILISIGLILPMVIDGLGQAIGYWKSTNPRRLITGISGGASQTILTMVIAVLILRLFS